MRIKDRPQSAMSLFKSQIQNVFNLKSNPAGKRGQSLKFLENCNIFTIVGRREALNVKREATEFFLILTGWILKAFSGIAPRRTGARIGAALIERRIEPIQPLPLNKFSPTSEILFPFSSLTTDYRLLTTALLGATPQNGPPCPRLTKFSPPVTRFSPPLTTFSPPLARFSP